MYYYRVGLPLLSLKSVDHIPLISLNKEANLSMYVKLPCVAEYLLLNCSGQGKLVVTPVCPEWTVEARAGSIAVPLSLSILAHTGWKAGPGNLTMGF